MKYINNRIIELISSYEPDINGETMILINGFEDLKLYNLIARSITTKYKSDPLTVDVKLAGRKWLSLSDGADTTTKQSMLQNGWVADRESITYYRNLHESNILVLMGTEDEEDTGGLKNCFSITPEILLHDLKKDYSKIFKDCFCCDFDEDDRKCLNKMYQDLFEFVAPDICFLSDLADYWEEAFFSFQDFITEFYRSLPELGLPYRLIKLPARNKIEDKKKNFLRQEYNFISRKEFNKISKRKYDSIVKKLKKYDEEMKQYSSCWDGWATQGFNDYDEFCDTILAFARGEDVKRNKERFLNMDYSIVNAILKTPLKKVPSATVSDTTVLGDPLHAFLTAFLLMLRKSKSQVTDLISKIEIEYVQSEIVTGFTDADDSEKTEQLRKIWKNICVHTEGIIDYINIPDWKINENSVEFTCANEDIFRIDKVDENIQGIVRTATGTNTLNKVKFILRAFDKNNNQITYLKDSEEEDLEMHFCWKFRNESGWLYDFSDVVCLDLASCEGSKVIPIGSFKKIKNTMVVKSEEEFFDLLDESDIDYGFDLVNYLKNRIGFSNNNDELNYRSLFEDLGGKFCVFIKNIAEKGLYKNIGSDAAKKYIRSYNEIAKAILSKSFAENQLWILDAYIHAFNIEENTTFFDDEENTECSIVPPWHPTALEKILEQKRYILDGIYEAWIMYDSTAKGLDIDETLADLYRTTEIQSAVDIFPAESADYLGIINTFGSYSVYGNGNKTSEIKTRVKDLIKREAIYDEAFDKNEFTRMNDDARMIYDVIKDYNKALPSAKYSLSLVFVNPTALQPIIAAIYRYTKEIQDNKPDQLVNINMAILVKPENKGGRNYLSYWMDDYFSQESNVYIRTYLNEWSSKAELERLLNPNNDIVFNMDLLHVNSFSFVPYSNDSSSLATDCRFPIIYKPSPLSKTSKKRKIELTQPQFTASFNHTQVVRYRRNSEMVPVTKYIAVRESALDKETQQIINLLHTKAYWVVCVDRVMDGALLKSDAESNYSIIGFSTGKGTYGQYNLTITARNSILDSLKGRLARRLYQLFQWQQPIINDVVSRVMQEASYLDGISLLSAINQKDNNVNEFMAYVLTSLRERKIDSNDALRIIVHLDSYKHWFNNATDTSSRPDFLMLSVVPSDDILKIKATIIECKISSYAKSNGHITKARAQVEHGLSQLKMIFDPASESKERRYWYSQLYRALVFAQVSFSDNTEEFGDLSGKLRAILDGKFSIEWQGKVLGYWFDMQGADEVIEETPEKTDIINVPQLKIQEILTGGQVSQYVQIAESNISTEGMEEDDNEEIELERIERKERAELEEINRRNRKREKQIIQAEPEVITESNDAPAISTEDPPAQTAAESIGEVYHEAVQTTDDPALTNNQVVSLEETRVKIGEDRGGNEVFWEFGNPQLANRHLLITGTSGQGKTYSIQTMLYEVSKSNISSVIFDYTEGFRLDQLEEEFVQEMEGRIEDRIIYFTGVPINPFKINEIEVAGMKAPEKISDVAQRIANILAHVYKFGEQQFAAIFDACRVGLEKHGAAMNMQILEEELNESSNKTAKSVVAKMAPFFHSVEFVDENLDWKDVLYTNEGKVTIFQLTNFVREIQVIITEFLLWDMWHYTKKYGNKDKPFVSVLDEAQNLSHRLNSPSGMILTEGRKFGWSAWYATQSTKILSDDEVVRLMQSAFKLYFKPTDEEIVAMAKQLNPTDFNEWKAPLTNLKKGQCIVVGSRIQNNGKFSIGHPTITSVTPFDKRINKN